MLLFLLIVFAIFILTKWIFPAVGLQLNWASAGPIFPEPLDIQLLPEPLRDRVQLAVAQLEAIGFRTIGACKWRATRNQTSCYVVLVRDDFVSEIAFSLTAKRPSYVVIGQGFTDSSQIIVDNGNPASVSDNGEQLKLPGVTDLSKLDFVAQRMIIRHRGDRIPIIPTDVFRYKANDLGHWQRTIAKSEYYRLAARHNRYRPNLRYFVYVLHRQMFTNRKSARRVSLANISRLESFLHDLDCGTLQSLRSPALNAFPVVFEGNSTVDISKG